MIVSRMRWIMLLLVWLPLAAGCHHYLEVQDPRTGKVYYTDQWVAADGYRGPLHFTDSKGQPVQLRAARVTWITRNDYIEATSSEAEPH